jgi:hypothetical protein
VNFTSEFVDVEHRTWTGIHTYQDEKNMRCTIGGFKVIKMASCNEFKLKVD